MVRGRMGHQVLGGEPQFAGPGDLVVWPAGTAHKWWNAGDDELLTTGWCKPPDNVVFFLATLFASAKANGGRPGLFDAAFLLTRYRGEFAMLELPTLVRRIMMPVLYVVGSVLGKYRKFGTHRRRSIGCTDDAIAASHVRFKSCIPAILRSAMARYR